MKNILDKSKKAQATILTIVVIAAIIIAIGLGVYTIFFRGEDVSQQVVQQQVAAAQASKSGDVASIGVYVRDLANNNVNTKIAVPVYCMGDDNTFIIDGTSSSTSAEITGKTTVGTTVTCWAFNATTQTLKPTVLDVDEEIEHIVIDAYALATSADVIVYDSTLTAADNGNVNLSVGADGSDSFAKMKFRNNNTDKWIPLGGFFIDVTENTNISNIDMSGGVNLFGFSDAPETSISKSSLTTAVSDRKSKWDYVFELSPDANGNNVLIIDENDYIETSPLTFESSVGCTAGSTGAQGIIKAFISGYFRETKNTGVAYGHETDASSAAVIATDIVGETVYCN